MRLSQVHAFIRTSRALPAAVHAPPGEVEADKATAISAAIEIDLTGQVCADSLGTMIFSGIGGQMDFLRGAALSRGGKPIIAMPSTAAHGTVSRITAQLKPGAGVVTTRGHVHWVVTEYGARNLHGMTLRELLITADAGGQPADQRGRR